MGGFVNQGNSSSAMNQTGCGFRRRCPHTCSNSRVSTVIAKRDILVSPMLLSGFTSGRFQSYELNLKNKSRLGKSPFRDGPRYVQTLLSSRLLSKNLKIKIYKTIILSVVLYGCETWSLTLREECRVRVFENGS